MATLTGCRSSETVEIFGAAMGTQYSIQVITVASSSEVSILQQAIASQIERVESLFSTYRQESEVKRFNRSSTADWFSVSPEFTKVLSASQALHSESGGAFDLTVLPLLELWGFGSGNTPAILPSGEQIEQARRRLGMSLLESRGGPLPAVKKLRADISLDFSAIAKGYAVDTIAALLDAQSFTRYLVEFGGEIRARGANLKNESWRIAIEEPQLLTARETVVFPLHDAAVATSGSYRNFREHDGRRFSHAIDPTTGRPVTHSLLSVTVVHDSAMWADGLATALLVLGPEKGVKWAQESDLDALFMESTPTGYNTLATGKFNEWSTR